MYDIEQYMLQCVHLLRVTKIPDPAYGGGMVLEI